jgi:hypothetical protein
MRSDGRFLLCGAPVLTALLLACGCGTIPGTFGVSSEPRPSPDVKPGPPHRPLASAPSANSVAPVTPPGPAPIMPLNLAGPESPQDVISMQAQKLKAVEDDRKLLAARLAQLEATVQDRDRELREAQEDITKTSEEINRTRADTRRVRQENADLRDKLDKSQKEVIELRKQIIKMMEKEIPPGGGVPMEREPAKEP